VDDRQPVLFRKSVQVVGGKIAKTVRDFPAEPRQPFREGEILVDKAAVWLQDPYHLPQGALPIRDVVRHHVCAHEIEFVVAKWSLSNAFTSAFKELDPIPQFKATAKLGEFLEARFSQSF
jgi:hypothetical protein